jgi:hypothetical protein
MNPVDEYIATYLGPQKELLGFFHAYFKSLDLKPKIAYGLPFYYGKRWVCYLKPNTDGSLDVSYTRANQFKDPSGVLEDRGRRQIKSIVVHSLEDIPLAAIASISRAAIKLDQQKK